MAITFTSNLNPASDYIQSLGSSSQKWKVNGHVVELIEIQISQTSDTTITISNPNITSNHIVLNKYESVNSDIDYTTTNGSITLTCSSGFPSMTIYLANKL